MANNFAVLILTHGRADRVFTVNSLRKSGYTGDIYFVLDNQDDQEQEYRKRYGDKVIVFDKQAERENTDTIQNAKVFNCVVYARNAAFRIAKELGLKYFLVLDDDYKSFDWRWADGKVLRSKKILHFDDICDAFIKFLQQSGAHTVALAQAGDFIGGVKSTWKKGILRKAMNAFFFDVDKVFDYSGLTNEDVNAYVRHGQVGKLFFTITGATVVQTVTQTNAGGLTDIYLEQGTYVKSFYSVICRPDCVKVGEMGSKHKRIHHKIKWDYAVPQILNECHRKGDHE